MPISKNWHVRSIWRWSYHHCSSCLMEYSYSRLEMSNITIKGGSIFFWKDVCLFILTWNIMWMRMAIGAQFPLSANCSFSKKKNKEKNNRNFSILLKHCKNKFLDGWTERAGSLVRLEENRRPARGPLNMLRKHDKMSFSVVEVLIYFIWEWYVTLFYITLLV